MRIEQGQSIFDVAVEQTGTIESAFEIAEANGLALSDSLQADQVVEINAVTQNDILKGYFASKTLNSHVDTIADKLGGIGYMGIKINFIVS